MRCQRCHELFDPDEIEDGLCWICTEELTEDEDKALDDPRHDQAADLNKPPERKPE